MNKKTAIITGLIIILLTIGLVWKMNQKKEVDVKDRNIKNQISEEESASGTQESTWIQIPEMNIQFQAGNDITTKNRYSYKEITDRKEGETQQIAYFCYGALSKEKKTAVNFDDLIYKNRPHKELGDYYVIYWAPQEAYLDKDCKIDLVKGLETVEFMTTSVDTSSWKTYRSEEYGFTLRYPDNYYEIKEERGLVHFYHVKCAHTNKLPDPDCINLNIKIAKTPADVATVEGLIEKQKQGKLNYPINWAEDYKKKNYGNNEFVVSEFRHQSGSLYSISFVTLEKEDYYDLNFGLMSNVINDDDYILIEKIVSSFDYIQ